MDTFKVNEIAIYVHPESPHYGAEVEVLSGLTVRSASHIRTGIVDTSPRYLITNLYPDKASRFSVLPQYLRKKKPPLSTWEQVQADTQWNPNKEKIDA